MEPFKNLLNPDFERGYGEEGDLLYSSYTTGRTFGLSLTTSASRGSTSVVAVMLLTSGGWVEQLTGSALVAGDARQAIVRATLAAANRRLDALLP